MTNTVTIRSFHSNERILIIGGTGFIGKHLTNRCLLDTKYVTCLGLNRNKSLSFKEAELLHVDIANKDQVMKTLSNRSFDYVFNLGGYINHTPYFKGGRNLIDSHFNALLNLLDVVDMKQLKGFVQIGSSDEYGNIPAPQREDMRESPISPYSFAKAAATHLMETISKTESFPGVVLRFFLVYGPGQDEQRFLPQIIKSCLQNKEFKASEGKQLRDFCFVDDIADAMIKAALCQDSFGKTINIASGIAISIREVIERTIALTGGGIPLWGTFPYRKEENMALFADITLAKDVLGWHPKVSLEDGLRKTIDYYRHSLK